MHLYLLIAVAYDLILLSKLADGAESAITHEALIDVAGEPDILEPNEDMATNLLLRKEVVERSEAYGERQHIDGAEEDITLQRLIQVDAYMYDTVFLQDESIRKDCRNEDELCIFWATIGECEDNPSFMMNKCAPACYGCSPDETASEIEENASHTFHDFYVAGRNLASYRFKDALSDDKDEPPFELYEDFDIGHLIKGNESWNDILAYRNKLERPSLSFYVDKVARKRWLPTKGYAIPKLHALHYAEELSKTGNQTEETEAILRMLPSGVDFAAKPTHKSLLQGTWLTNYDAKTGKTFISQTGRKLKDEHEYNASEVAASLAAGLHSPPDEIESWALKNVKPGFVVEELWMAHDDNHVPPHELNIFTIWGKVWLGQWNIVEDELRGCLGFFYRNGTASPGSSHMDPLPDWMDWPRLVEIAEEMGAHKDMFRMDIFVGIPSNDSLLDVSIEERTKELQIALSESEIFPTTIFHSEEMTDEAARLWVAGYKMGNYRVVPNDEVPAEFVETGRVSEFPLKKESK